MKNFALKQLAVITILIGGAIGFTVLTIIIGTNDGTFLKSPILYKSIYSEVSGLNVGSVVTIHGTRTGNVVKTNLLENGKIEVTFSIKKDHDFIINQSTTAQLKTQGVLGDRYINVETTDLSAPKLNVGDMITTKPPLDILSLLGGSGDSKKSVNHFVKELGRFMKNLNDQGGFGSVLGPLKRILKKVDSGQGSLGALINDRNAYNRLLILLGEKPKYNYLKDLSGAEQK